MTHAQSDPIAAFQQGFSCQIGTRMSRICYEALPRLISYSTRGATVSSPETTISLVVMAVLLGIIAALVVGYLAYDGTHTRKAIMYGVFAFGGTTAGVITIEHEIGLF